MYAHQDYVNKRTQAHVTSTIAKSNNPDWVTPEKPQGETFEIGKFIREVPKIIRVEVFNQRKKSVFGEANENEPLGYAEISTDDLVSLENLGQEHLFFLDDSKLWKSSIKLRTLFLPSEGTLKRHNLGDLYRRFLTP